MTDPGNSRSRNSFGNVVSNKLNSSGKAIASTRTVAERHKAAQKLAAVFRGHKGRKDFQTEQRKVDAIKAIQENERLEAERPKPRQVLRPQGKSFSGF